MFCSSMYKDLFSPHWAQLVQCCGACFSKWGKWSGAEPNKYSMMTYENGQNCWNGPNRSVKVHLKCGVTNQLLAASEPSRCEYEYRFETPAACADVMTTHLDPDHDEL